MNSLFNHLDATDLRDLVVIVAFVAFIAIGAAIGSGA
jgi:hypothetical protein